MTGARTPADAELPLSEMGWPLMRWVRYMAAVHVVRVLAGTLVRGTPVWTWYLRLNGARIPVRRIHQPVKIARLSADSPSPGSDR